MSVDRAGDELAIRNAVARLAQLADDGDVAAYVALMTEDVVWSMPPSPHVDLPGSERTGRTAIADGAHERIASGLQGPGSRTMHTVGTTAVEFVADDEAVARSSFVFWGDTTGTPAVQSVGRYRDTFRRTDGGWRLARRDVTFG